jgi:hypothetical protein
MRTNDPSTSNTVPELVTPAIATNVSALVQVARASLPGLGKGPFRLLTIQDTSGQVIQGPLYLVLDGLNPKVHLKNASGVAQHHGHPGDPFLLDNLTLNPGGGLTLILQFANPKHKHIGFSTEVLAGPGAV